MRVKLIIDAKGPNPLFKPPDPRVDPVGFHTYDVPQTIVIPAGTELPEHYRAWAHCLPDASGVIRAVPVDDEAKQMVALKKQQLRGKAAQQMEHFEALQRAAAEEAKAKEPPAPTKPEKLKDA